MTQILTIIGSILTIIIAIGSYFGRKNAEKRKQAEQAKKDLDEAKKNDNPSDFIDAWSHL